MQASQARSKSSPQRSRTLGGERNVSNDSDLERVTELARQHLAPHDADRWLRLLRPAARLVPAQDADVVVARLGGAPHLPTGMAWPTWDRHGPLTFIAEINLEALAELHLETGITLPTQGRLSLFYWDGCVDNGAAVVGPWDKETLGGVRLLYLTEPHHELVAHPAPIVAF